MDIHGNSMDTLWMSMDMNVYPWFPFPEDNNLLNLKEALDEIVFSRGIENVTEATEQEGEKRFINLR